jgi:hypothetical protein
MDGLKKSDSIDGAELFRHCHCEPTGRANARPMTGSAKQSIVPRKERMDCSAPAALRARVESTRISHHSSPTLARR